MKSRRSEGARKTKDFLCKLSNNTCNICKNVYPSCVFDFHHVRGEKKFNISEYLKKHLSTKFRVTQELIDEVNKCILICSNCHREIHSGYGANSKNQ